MSHCHKRNPMIKIDLLTFVGRIYSHGGRARVREGEKEGGSDGEKVGGRERRRGNCFTLLLSNSASQRVGGTNRSSALYSSSVA